MLDFALSFITYIMLIMKSFFGFFVFRPPKPAGNKRILLRLNYF